MAKTASEYKKYRILILTYEENIPPDDVKGVDLEKQDWKLEYDVITTLNRMNQDVRVLGVSGELGVIRTTIHQFKPHICFNLLDEFDGEALFDQNVVSYLELLKVPYTGCNPRGLILARDKLLTKKLLTYHRIAVPKHAIFPIGKKVRATKAMKFPLFVKSATEEASLGIAQSSIVYDEKELIERVQFIHEKVLTDALAESYIEGRELYVGVMGNHRIQTLPIWELKFLKAPDEVPRIATRKVKWDPAYRKKLGITSGKARPFPPELEQKIHRICRRTYKILGLNGYARIDLRLTKEGEVYVLEANPNPQIAYEEDLAESAREAGLNYKDFLWKIINLGLKWQPNSLRFTD